MQSGEIESPFDLTGEYRNKAPNPNDGEIPTTSHIASVSCNLHTWPTDPISAELEPDIQVNKLELAPSKIDAEKMREYFLYAPTKAIQDTFEVTTQNARSGWISGEITQSHRSPFPGLNIPRRNEALATDTLYSDVPAIFSGVVIAQLFVGVSSLHASVYGMKTEKQFVDRLNDEIRKRGAPDKQISDRAQLEISNKVKEVLRYSFIDDWQSEPNYQHQNPAERRYRHIKRNCNNVLNRTGAPAYTWLLCLMYVCFIMNRMALHSIGGRAPAEHVYGETPDISMIPRFRFWEPVYYQRDSKKTGKEFPSSSNEEKGRFVGFSEDVGHKLTFKILTDDTQQVIYRSRVRSAVQTDVNYRLEDHDKYHNPQDNQEIVKSKTDDKPIPVIDFDNLIGRTFLMLPQEDGTRLRAKIVERLEQMDREVMNQPDMIKFRCSVNDGQYEEIMAHNDIIDRIEQDETQEGVWKFKSIDGHQGPLTKNDKAYKGSKYNLKVTWETGEVTYEPLAMMIKDDPVTVAVCAKENNLLETAGWKRLKGIAKRQKKLLRMVNQAKMRSHKHAKRYKFGVEVPKNHKDAMRLDEENGNTLWRDAELTELSQIDEYSTFQDLGQGDLRPEGHKRIRVHMVYDVKHDGRRKARLVADGHLTDVPTDSTYSSVVSIRGLRLVVFLAELNGHR